MVVRKMSQATDDSTKMQPKYQGPLVVTEVLASDTYRIANMSQIKVYKPQEDENDDEEDAQSKAEECEAPQLNKEPATQSSFTLSADQLAK